MAETVAPEWRDDDARFDPAALTRSKGDSESEEVEHLGFEHDQFGPAAQFASFGIEHVIAKPENHP